MIALPRRPVIQKRTYCGVMQVNKVVDKNVKWNARAAICHVWLTMLVCMLVWFAQPAKAAEITFLRAYTGTISGQTFTANGTLVADPGSINFNDGGTSRNFTNTDGILSFTVAGVPTSLTGQLTSRHPQGGTIAEAVVFTASSGTSYLLVLTGTNYNATYRDSGSANQILAGLNNYLSTFTADPGTSTILVGGAASTTVTAGTNASVVVTAKLANGTPISGATVVLIATPSANSSITAATTTSDGTGSAVSTVTNSAAETVTYQATVTYGGSDTLLTSTVSVAYTVTDTTKPVITGPNAATSAGTGTDGTTIEAGATAVASFSANEAVTWTLGGTSAGLFEITTGGVLALKDPSAVGTYVVDITAEDAAGNISVLTFTLIVADTTKPAITGPNAATSAGTGTDSATIEAGTTAVASFSADEAVTWTLAGTNAGLFEITTAGVLTLKDPSVVGTYVVDITAEDAAGNISVLTLTLTVEDTTKPVITGPNAATSAGIGTDSATIEAGTTAVASFSANETVTWTLGGTNAGLFEITTAGVLTLKDPGVVGTYVVDITAEDAPGNISVLTFTLTVEDTTKPVITGPNAATSAGIGTDESTIEAGTTAVASFSANETVTWTLGGTNAGLFEITTAGVLTLKDPGVVGTYVVDITAEDAAGNISVLTFTLTVEDKTKAVITGPNAATSAGTGTDETTIKAGTTAVANFSANETVTWTLAGTDAGLFEITTAGVLTLKDPGVVGTYVVDITAEDAAGNISVLTFTLTVERATYIEAEADKSTGIANSADAVEITVTLTDENNLPVVGKAVELTTDFGTLFINPSGTTVLTRDNGDGTYTAFLRSDEPGKAIITVTIDGVDQLNKLFVDFILIDETGSALNASPNEIRANGSDTSQITVSLYDAEGSLLTAGGDTVTLISTLGTLSAVSDNGDGTYSATLTASTEVGVATVSGSVNGIAIATSATVRFSADQHAVRDAFTDVTSAFIHRRMERILSAEPRSHHLDRRREATAGPQFSMEYQRNSGELASRLQFAGQLGDMPRGGLDVSASEASPSSFLRFSGNVTSTDSSWYFWTEGQYSAYQDATGVIAERDGSFGIVFLGVDYLVNDWLTFGVMAHADRVSEGIDGYSEVSGNGGMVGPYLSAEVTDGLFFSGRVAWGQSRNSASIDVFADNTQWSGSFGTERFLARGAFYGSYELGSVHLRPQVDLAYMRENQKDYVVSDGVLEVSVVGIDAEIGRLTLSTEAEWSVADTIYKMNAFVVPRLDWHFHTSAPHDQSQQASGSLEFGLRTAPDAGWSSEAAVRYDGLGQSGFEAWTMRLGARLDF